MMYAPLYRNIPQSAEHFENRQQSADDFQLLFSIPWNHHRRIIDKCKGNMDKAMFFVRVSMFPPSTISSRQT